MLQRQIIFKQLQELQQKQQLQELGDARNQHYINKRSSLKQASGGQFPSAADGMPVRNSSQMLMVGKVQMMQGMHNKSEIVPSHNHSMIQVGLPHPQFGASLYGASTLKTDMNLDLYSRLQGPPDHSAKLSTKYNNGALEMPSMQSSGFSNSLLDKQSNLYSDQLSMPDESLLPNQVPVQGFSGGISNGNYSHQGMTAQRNAVPLESETRQENVGWHELTPRKVLKPAPSDPNTSLDPLEQKFLYSTDDNIWGSSFSESIDIGGLGTFESATEHTSYMDRFPTTQGGSWSALMQSAVAEISSGDGGVQEEWSGLNFQNPELLTGNQTSNYIDNAKQKSNWVDTDLPNSSSPSAKTEIVPHYSNIIGSYPGFQQSGHQYLREKEGFHSESSHVSNQHSPRNTSQYYCQPKHPMECSQQFQGSSFPNIWLGQRKEHLKSDVCHLSNNNQPGLNMSDHELRDTIWLQGSNPRDIQKPFDQVDHKMMVDQLNIHSYSIESEKISSGKNGEPVQVLLRASSDLYSQSMISQASNTMLDLRNKDSTSINHAPGMQFSAKVSDHNDSPRTETSVASCAKPCDNSPISLDLSTPQSDSLVPSLAMGNSCSTYHPSGHNVNNRFENQHSPALCKPTDMATKDLVYSSDYSMLKNANLISSEFPVAQAAVTSVSSQHMGFLTGLASQWVDMTTQPSALSVKPPKSPNFFCSRNSESSSLETSSVLPNEQSSRNSFRQEYNVQGFSGPWGKPEYHEQELGAESFLQKGSTEMISVSRDNHEQDLYRENHVEAIAVGSSSLMTQSHQPSHNERIDTESPSSTARDLKSLALSQTKAMLHQVQSSQNAAVMNVKGLFLHEQKEGINSEAKGYSDAVSHLGAFPSLDSKGWYLQEAWRAQSDKGYPPNIQNMQMLGQNGNQNCYNDNNDACNTSYQPQISLQLAQYISKHDGTLKNEQLFRTYDPKAAGNTVNQFSGMTIESNMLPSITATLTPSEQSSPNKLPSYVTCQTIAVSAPKKRKVEFDMVPRHKEVKRYPFMLENIRVSELEWAAATNRRPEEVKNEAEILEDMQPRFRSKRRLVFATQLMQQIFKPAHAAILSSDAGSNCDGVTYFAARFGFADACLVTSNSQMASDGNGILPDKLKTYKRCNASDFSEVVEGLFDKVARLEGELLRMDKSLSIVDAKVESQELEKLSIINRFAKFHIKAKPPGADPIACNGTSTVSKTYPQRYVSAHPMPKTVPEGTGCQAL